MILPRIGLAIAIAVAGSAPPPAGLMAAQSQTPPQPPVIRSGVTLVQVDAIVTDEEGRFVADLSQADFEIFDDGAPQTIQTFTVVQSSRAPAPHSGPVPSSPHRTVQPNATSVQRVFVLMFDEEHVRPGAFERLRDAALRFLDREYRDGDIGGVVVSSRMAGNRLTASREELKEAVKAARPSGEKRSREIDRREWPRISSDTEAARIDSGDREVLRIAVQRACAEDPTLCRRIDPEPQIRQKARFIADQARAAAGRTLTALRALAGGLEKVPGRKTIVLMTDGFFASDGWPALKQIVGLAARSNTRIYAIDTRGTDVHGQSQHLFGASITDPYGAPPVGVYDASTDAPNALAVDTGGFVIRNTNDFSRALAQIAQDTSDYYVIGYRPSQPASEGSFRSVDVKVKRPGVTVRARRGYRAVAGPAASAPDEAPGRAGVAPVANDTPELAPVPLLPTGDAELAVPGTNATERIRKLMQHAASAAKVEAPVESAAGTRTVPYSAGIEAAERGWKFYQRGDLESAQRHLAQAAADAHTPVWVHYALGQAEFALSRYGEAAAAWTVVRETVPEFEPVYFDLADAWLRLDDLGAATDVLRAAEARWPADPEVLNALGVAQVRQGTLDAATRTFVRAIEAVPDDAIGHYNLARTYELRYLRSRRYITSLKRWVANDDHRRKALEHYERCLTLGGPFESSARDAISRLQWAKQN